MVTLSVIVDLAATLVFALSGAVAGVKNQLDLFGVLVLAFVAGNAGGVARDVLIGAVPPQALNDSPYLGVSLLAGFSAFVWYGSIDRLRSPLLIFDAAGLALFAVSGTQKALDHALSPVMASLVGMLTGIGGGMMRDLLVMQIPTVLRAEFYAVAALAGATVVAAAPSLHVPAPAAMLVGALFCFWLRVMSIRRGWQLPAARPPS